MATEHLSLRKTARILGITPAYLSMLVNGKRQWKPDLYERYCELVNTVNKTEVVDDLSAPVTRRSLVAHLHGVQGDAGPLVLNGR